ncbi:peroxiredoxin family protein [uncultured Microscilla sp.]|uniref:peroxiredoxin family protein n=1 Tax=uncultured Microscilla sp. TaxID=432653 RepID=UPI002632303D|nr:peroxiredoxin family protein [uncultured Microscilla sp.]
MINVAKSIFITAFPVYGMIIGIYAVCQLLSGFSLPWLGVALGGWAIALMFAGLFIFRPFARTKATMPKYTTLILASTGWAIVTAYATQTPPVYAAIVFAVSNTLGWLIYIYWYSRFNLRSKELLAVGKPLPSFVLENEAGEQVQSKSFDGHPTLWMFYRGNWCPLCMAQIKEVAQQYKELSQRGVKVALVSPQPHGYSRQLAEKMKVPFYFLVDVKNRAARQLEIISENGIPKGFEILGYDSDTVLPTVIITNAEGKIIFADLTNNYRVRPEPATFLKVLDEEGGECRS